MKKKLFVVLGMALAACSPAPTSEPGSAAEAHPSILLVTLDTTRADRTGLETDAVATPNLERLAARGLYFTQAYTTAPMTLPAHASMLTGLYPSEHGIHENARYLADDKELLAAPLRERGYKTAAFVSGLPLARQFGLSRGFDHYDDDFGSSAERRAGDTTDQALAYLEHRSAGCLFLWVHYYDPHEPYAAPESFHSRYESSPYLAEIAYMDQELGRLVDAFESRFREGGSRILVVGDHGEGLGDHGEALHGNLVYQGVMRVPMIAAGSGIAAGRMTQPVSVRRVFDTVLAWAGVERSYDLVEGGAEVVMGEAMKPFLQYGWQPQVMAVRGSVKVIRSGDVEIYDIGKDPAESRNLDGAFKLNAELREAIRSYPVPAPRGEAGVELSQDDKEKLAALGYVDWQGQAAPRPDAPNPRDMTGLFTDLDAGSGYFVRQEYEKAIPVFERVFERDPGNLMVAVRLAVASSVLGHDREALDYFERAREIDPDSVDVRHYLAMHYFRAGEWDKAEPLLASVLERMPDRLPALESMARIRESQGRIYEAIELLQRIVARKTDSVESLLKLGELSMAVGDTAAAIQAYEGARRLQGGEFAHFLELGVLYLADRRLEEARECLDRVPPEHPGYAMALFKRAQVSVLLGEPDSEQRIRLAYERGDSTTRPLIEGERLFQGIVLP